MGDGPVVDAAAAGGRLHVILGDILGDAHRPKYALAVICRAARRERCSCEIMPFVDMVNRHARMTLLCG